MSEELVRGGFRSIDTPIEETVNPTISYYVSQFIEGI